MRVKRRADPLLPPGQYQLRLKLGDQTRTAALTVVADPRVPNSDAAIAAKTALALATYHDIDTLHRAVNDIRARRKALKSAAPPPASTPNSRASRKRSCR